ncbi:hypothetical protein [Rickettsia amblyommatis]|uniref:Putative rND efflux transporter-like protein n=1 Tax=Rickettsia amblyommatis str. Ac/Pa TaxID=1359164 RepID=A0A0F3N1Y1_RICAM|nr:hypothetical protein [Rickettsia amblyommatis]KJV62060.1 putative rND efflux transporter-like protein [Rickettsia amblyommatis str. Ac/Pa]KJV94970.1 putative rND efflux transporter-like protein [Rickettsia amblyommatis str. Darkwater]
MLILLLVIIATAYLFVVFTDAAQTISFDAMVQEQQQVSDVLLKNPNIDSFWP